HLLLGSLQQAAAAHPMLQRMLRALRCDLMLPPDQQEALARRFVQRLVLIAQGTLMLRHAPMPVAEAFIASRCDAESGRVYGTLTSDSVQTAILERAWPV
ncbi:MAG: DNA alkylation response protein, partial [Burkholderiaceae bacterium]